MVEHAILSQVNNYSAVDNENYSANTLINEKAINFHSHVHCLDTGKILEVKLNLSNSLIQQAIKEIEQETGIQIVEYRFDLLGYQNSKFKNR